VKNIVGSLMGIALNIASGNVPIITIIILLIHEHGLSSNF
jgi:hypothetical protein